MNIEEIRSLVEDAKSGKTISSKRMCSVWEMVFKKPYKYSYCLTCLKRDINKLETELKALEMANFMVELQIPDTEVKEEPIKKITKKKNG